MIGLLYSLAASLYLGLFALGLSAPVLPFLLRFELLLSISLIPVGIYFSTITLIHGVPLGISLIKFLKRHNEELVFAAMMSLVISGSSILFGSKILSLFFFALSLVSYVMAKI